MSAEEFFADEYKMDYPQRGRAIIINNREFDRGLGLGERTGTDQDASSLQMRFMDMGFEVDLYNNLVAGEMQKVLVKGLRFIFFLQQIFCYQ
jgi:hypothetical protein